MKDEWLQILGLSIYFFFCDTLKHDEHRQGKWDVIVVWTSHQQHHTSCYSFNIYIFSICNRQKIKYQYRSRPVFFWSLSLFLSVPPNKGKNHYISKRYFKKVHTHTHCLRTKYVINLRQYPKPKAACHLLRQNRYCIALFQSSTA